MKSLVVAFIFLFSLEAFAANCNNPTMLIAQTTFDLSSNTTVNPTITVRANTSPGGCDFFITFDYGLASSYTGRALRRSPYSWPFTLSKNSTGTQILKKIPDVAGPNDVLSGTLTSGSSNRQVSVNYFAILSVENPWLYYGLFSDTFTASLYIGSANGSYTFIESKTLTFQYTAPKKVDISISNSGGSFDVNDFTETLNFGTLSPGTVRSCDAILKYNAGYILYASSANNSSLKQESGSATIPYTIKFNNTSFNLSNSASSPVEIARELGVSPASGRVVPISATIGSFGVKPSGIYKDTITLTVQSAE
ncbi:hypothetical protein ACES2L_00895 [Bdellovibrio bacteriovorus]